VIFGYEKRGIATKVFKMHYTVFQTSGMGVMIVVCFLAFV